MGVAKMTTPYQILKNSNLVTERVNSNDARAITIAIVKLVGGAGHGIVGGAGVNVHPRKLDREIFADRPSAKIGSLENFRLYGILFLSKAVAVRKTPPTLPKEL